MLLSQSHRRLRTTAGIIVLSAVLAACSFVSRGSGPASLAPQPTTPVQTQTLTPPSPTTATAQQSEEARRAAAVSGLDQSNAPPVLDDTATTTAPATQTAVAAATPASSQVATVETMSGGYTITSGGDACPLFVSTTAWSGGFRAVTRGCQSDRLKSVSAWNIEGGQVVLKNGEGSEIARLAKIGETSYRGGGVAFAR